MNIYSLFLNYKKNHNKIKNCPFITGNAHYQKNTIKTTLI